MRSLASRLLGAVSTWRNENGRESNWTGVDVNASNAGRNAIAAVGIGAATVTSVAETIIYMPLALLSHAVSFISPAPASFFGSLYRSSTLAFSWSRMNASHNRIFNNICTNDGLASLFLNKCEISEEEELNLRSALGAGGVEALASPVGYHCASRLYDEAMCCDDIVSFAKEKFEFFKNTKLLEGANFIVAEVLDKDATNETTADCLESNSPRLRAFIALKAVYAYVLGPKKEASVAESSDAAFFQTTTKKGIAALRGKYSNNPVLSKNLKLLLLGLRPRSMVACLETRLTKEESRIYNDLRDIATSESPEAFFLKDCTDLAFKVILEIAAAPDSSDSDQE